VVSYYLENRGEVGGYKSRKMVLKFGLLTFVGIMLSLAALYWIEPQTKSGQVLLVIIVMALVNGIGAITWRKPAG
jgi:uncharacterized membrane protein YccC